MQQDAIVVQDGVVRVREINAFDRWSTWHMTQNLTDRWGDLNYNGTNNDAVADLHADIGVLDRLRGQMWDETTFVVRKDGAFGILFEVELCSKESEAKRESEDAEWYAGLKHDSEVLELLRVHLTGIAGSFPGVLFSVPEEKEIIHGRPAAWAFVADGLLSDEQRESLGRALVSI